MSAIKRLNHDQITSSVKWTKASSEYDSNPNGTYGRKHAFTDFDTGYYWCSADAKPCDNIFDVKSNKISRFVLRQSSSYYSTKVEVYTADTDDGIGSL